jgi:hypothetical protein
VVICNRKQGHYSDRIIFEMMILNEIHYNLATSTYLQVICLVLKSPHTQNMLLRIESTGRRTYHKQVKVVCYYMYIELMMLITVFFFFCNFILNNDLYRRNTIDSPLCSCGLVEGSYMYHFLGKLYIYAQTIF